MEIINYPFGYTRQPSRIVKVGDLELGGGLPIRIQSMLSTPTHDVAGCLEEIRALNHADCEMIRLTVPSRKDLAAMPEIRRLMKEEGIQRPLIADVHFSPQLAVDACEFFEKVRINPGNFSDKPKSGSQEGDTGSDFEEGHARLREAIGPLVRNLEKYRRALRIGVNHGSLSTRMIERYGDSPQGMVASALEMIELFEDQGYDQLIVSLKSSNPIVVQKAYRLLVEKQAGGNPVALHLGVTEAGNDVMGRIKSLVGIGVLLADGIGDTIRVSLTEPGPNEIAFAKKLIGSIPADGKGSRSKAEGWSRDINHRRSGWPPLVLDNTTLGDNSGLKIGRLVDQDLPAREYPFEADFTYHGSEGRIFLDSQTQPLEIIDVDLSDSPQPDRIEPPPAELIQSAKPLYDLRRIFSKRDPDRQGPPIGLMVAADLNSFGLFQEIQLAGVLSEGLVDFLLLPPEISRDSLTRFLSLLQATRVRLITTDYIICPSCGRTLFDIEQTAAEIKRHTRHLKGLKIGVMGCIVNGPGEMADADFGYVGSGNGKVDLYFGQLRVRRGIDEGEAVEKLIELIKEKGRWQEPLDPS